MRTEKIEIPCFTKEMTVEIFVYEVSVIIIGLFSNVSVTQIAYICYEEWLINSDWGTDLEDITIGFF